MRVFHKIIKEKETVIWTFWMVLSLWILGVSLLPSQEESDLQQQISTEILRFHVLANSDSREDQEEKMEVKNAVVDYMEPFLKDSSSKEETMELINRNMEKIEEISRELVYPRNVKVTLEKDWFPEIAYGDCTFPEGEYDTLRIQIGNADGHNWWCVLYPGLCFSDAVQPVVTEEGKEQLEDILDEECYDFLLHPAETKIRFRWLGLEFFGENG